MELTTNNVLSLLRPYRGRPYIQSDKCKKYKQVSLLPDDSAGMRSDILYVCRLSEALMRTYSITDCHFVCICDRYLSEEDRDELEEKNCIILVEENRDIPWLFNLIQARYLELNQWESEMKDAIIAGCDYQMLFDISERYLRNSLFALDATYRLIANSRNYMSSDPMNVQLYETGYYTQETLKRFYAHKRFVAYNENKGPVVSNPGDVSSFESVTQWCRADEVPLVQIVEVFSHSPMSAESLELFEVMMKYINICFKREQEKNQGTTNSYTRLLREIIYGEFTDTQKMAAGARNAGIQLNGDFDAYRITFRDAGQVLIGRFVNELSQLLPNSKIVARNYEVTLFNSYSGSRMNQETKANIEKISPLLQRHGALCGVSAHFSSFIDLRMACQQAAIAVSYADVYEDSECMASGTNVYYYRDVFIYHMIHASTVYGFDTFHNGPYVQKLKYLENYDADHGTELLDVLYWYLYYERRTTEAGRVMHMHRNTVMYHIQRIVELLEIDLDDYHTRQGLLMSYHFRLLNHHLERDGGSRLTK